MKKNLLTLVLTLVTVFFMVACDSVTEPVTPDTNGTFTLTKNVPTLIGTEVVTLVDVTEVTFFEPTGNGNAMSAIMTTGYKVETSAGVQTLTFRYNTYTLNLGSTVKNVDLVSYENNTLTIELSEYDGTRGVHRELETN